MDKKLIEKIKGEAIYLLLLLIISVIIFKIVFYKEEVVTILLLSVSLFWLFVLPGFLLLYYYYDKFGFFERFVIGTVLGFAVVSISSYYLGIIGINVNIHQIILPIVFIIIAIILVVKKKPIPAS